MDFEYKNMCFTYYAYFVLDSNSIMFYRYDCMTVLSKIIVTKYKTRKYD